METTQICQHCTYWGKERDRKDVYQVCYRLWNSALFTVEGGDDRFPVITKPNFGCNQFVAGKQETTNGRQRN